MGQECMSQGSREANDRKKRKNKKKKNQKQKKKKKVLVLPRKNVGICENACGDKRGKMQ